MSAEVFYLSVKDDVPCHSYWDYTIIDDVFKVAKYHTSEVRKLTATDKAIVVIPARHHADKVAEINKELVKVKRLVLFLMGDEERVFPVEEINHPNAEIWVQNPHPRKDDKYHKIGTGYAPHNLAGTEFKKDIPLFFSGQITHKRRVEMQNALDLAKGDGWIARYTKSFTAGLDPADYFNMMARAKVVPAPSGAVIPDSFRTFEALQTMAVPIADEVNPDGSINGYWEWLFGGVVPFARISDWKNIGGYTSDILSSWPKIMHDQTAWWIWWKRNLAKTIREQLGEKPLSEVTVMVCTSPIISHPDTRIVDETIESIRHHLPDSEIILQIDGVRKEQEKLTDSYNEYKSRILWKCLHTWTNVLPVVFDEHMHQSGMARETLGLVDTPLLLYCEQDTPLVTDYEIPFKDLGKSIKSGLSNVIRLHFEAVIPKDHEHMMLGVEKTEPELMRTIQWSQRPHLASTAYYKRILKEYFSDETKSFIEDNMHGIVHNGYIVDGLMGWHQHRLHIYYPDGNLKRSYHTDGREGEGKFDDTQKF